MIRVERPEPHPKDVLDALAKPFPKTGKTEIELARKYYGRKKRPAKAYEFTRYKEFEVVRELERLFHEKCAYCESTYRAVGPLDVEHFRPKGKVKEAPKHPGYWWLAAAWSNLLPSCRDCNQLRSQLAFDPGMTLEEFDRARRKEADETSGKANSFPVRNANWILDEKGDLTAEDPLLINPTMRKPEEHLEWVFDWDRTVYLWQADRVAAAIRPRLVNGVDDPYGKASIAVYGLNRAGLVRERMARIDEMRLVCKPVVKTILRLRDVQTAQEVTWLQEDLAEYKASLLQLARPEKPYAGMASAFLAEFDAELRRLASAPPP
jgi:hypothetical protein